MCIRDRVVRHYYRKSVKTVVDICIPLLCPHTLSLLTKAIGLHQQTAIQILMYNKIQKYFDEQTSTMSPALTDSSFSFLPSRLIFATKILSNTTNSLLYRQIQIWMIRIRTPIFVIFINDWRAAISSKILKFADDTKILREVKNSADCSTFQSDVDKQVSWPYIWPMEFIVKKCKVMHVGRQYLR